MTVTVTGLLNGALEEVRTSFGLALALALVLATATVSFALNEEEEDEEAAAPTAPTDTAAAATDPGPRPATGLDTEYLEGGSCRPRPIVPRPGMRPLPARDPGPGL